MTEGDSRVIDRGGDAHRALQAAVAEHGPDVLSNVAVMDGICRERLGAFPGEANSIGTAARANVPALLQTEISRLGNYGGMQSVAGTLSSNYGLDRAGALWVVREYARALGLIASGGIRSARRPGEGSRLGLGEAGAVGAGLGGSGLAGTGLAGTGLANSGPADAGPAGDQPADDGPADADLAGPGAWDAETSGSGAPNAEANTMLSQVPPVLSDPDEAEPGATVLSEAAGSRPGPGDTMLSRAPAGAPEPVDTAGLADEPEPVHEPVFADEPVPADEPVFADELGPADEVRPADEPGPGPGETMLDHAVHEESPFGSEKPGDTTLDRVPGDESGPGATVISPVPSSLAQPEPAQPGQAQPEPAQAEQTPGVADPYAGDLYAEAPPLESSYGDGPPFASSYGEGPAFESPYAEEGFAEEPHNATVFSEAAGGAAGAAAAASEMAPEQQDAEEEQRPDWAGAQGWMFGPGQDAGAPVPDRAGAEQENPPAGEEDRPGVYQGGQPREAWAPQGSYPVLGDYGPPPGGGHGYSPPPEGDGYPAPQPLPYATPKSNRNRNLLGIVAAVALVAVYLVIAAVLHLAPFPAKTSSTASTPPPSQTASTSASPSTSGSATGSPTPTSPAQKLLAKIPASIAGTNNCKDIGTANGALARLQCTGFTGPATGAIYYLYSDAAALNQGFASFLSSAKFTKERACTTDGKFVDFVVQCQDTYSNQSPAAAGSIAEYQRVNDFDPIIASTDTPQLVMTVLVGTNNNDLLTYWKQFGWIKS